MKKPERILITDCKGVKWHGALPTDSPDDLTSCCVDDVSNTFAKVLKTPVSSPMPFSETSAWAGAHVHGVGGSERPTHEDMRRWSLANPPTCPECLCVVVDCNTGKGHADGCKSPLYRPGPMAP